MENLRKAVGAFLDWAAMIMLFIYGAHNLVIQDYQNAALLFGVMGIWSISCSLHGVFDILTKESKNEHRKN